MKKHILKRSGKPDLRFIGKVLAEVDNYSPKKNRWQKITIFKTDSGKYVASIACLTWQEEVNTHTVYIGMTPQDVYRDLMFYPKLEDRLTRLAAVALKMAARVDPAFDAVFLEGTRSRKPAKIQGRNQNETGY